MIKLLVILAATTTMWGCTKKPDPCTKEALAIIARKDGIDNVLQETRYICSQDIGGEAACEQAKKDLAPVMACYFYLTE
jgi:hypothetical protein